jgi:hypothetical protein
MKKILKPTVLDFYPTSMNSIREPRILKKKSLKANPRVKSLWKILKLASGF